MADRVQRSFQTRQARKKDLATYFRKTGLDKPVNSSRALSDRAQGGERMARQVGHGSTLPCTGALGVGIHSRALAATTQNGILAIKENIVTFLLTWKNIHHTFSETNKLEKSMLSC